MSNISIVPGSTTTITQSETDTVTFVAAGTLNVTGTAQNPITVTLSSVGGIGALDTIGITNANVMVGGAVGVSALTDFRLGAGSTLEIGSAANISVGSTVHFLGAGSHLILDGATVNLLGGGLHGFSVNSSIDSVPIAATSLSYTDNTGSNTGGTIHLLSAAGVDLQDITLADGDFTAAQFEMRADGHGGTLIDLKSAVTAVTATPGTADLGAGNTVVFQLTTSDPVTVLGTPKLQLSNGGTAVFNASASTATSLAFRYIVGAGDDTPDLAVSGVTLNGATIANAGGGSLDLSGAITNPAGTLQIDTIAPTVLSRTDSPVNGSLAAGGAVTITLALSEGVTVSGGTPTLSLNDGGTATFVAALSTPTSLVFRHVVQAGQNASALAVTGLSLQGAAVTDGAGNSLLLTGAAGNLPGTLVIDTTAPLITGETASPGTGAVRAGQTVRFMLATTEPVTVIGGTPTIQLNDGGTATFDPTHSTATSLVFNYTVQAGQNTANLSVTGTSLGGATIADIAGNALSLAGAIGGLANTLQVDTTPPSITTVSAQAGSSTVSAGQTVRFMLATTEPVTVIGGTPTLQLNDGGTATFDPTHSTATGLVFNYTVQAGQNTANLSVTGTSLGGATIADIAGNALSLAGAIGSLASTLQVDTTAPTITAVSAQPGSGVLAAGQVVEIDVATSESVTVSGGIPTLALSDGGIATYDPSRSSPGVLAFFQTVQPGQSASPLTVIGDALNGATITDAAGNRLDLSGAIGGLQGSGLGVDAIAPTVQAVLATPGTGQVGTGHAVAIDIMLSAAVSVTGSPTLTLDDGGNAQYDPANSTGSKLHFVYTVQPGQNTSNLTITGVDLGSATVTDAQGNAVNLGAAATGLGLGVVSSIDVYRFFDVTTGTHFYTSSATERDQIMASRPDLVSEGVGLRALDPATADSDAAPVYRFFDTVHGTQFLTASSAERDAVIASRPDLTYEAGDVFYEHLQPQAGDTPVYRFFDTVLGTHFYTDSASERATIAQTRPDLTYEGVGFYEPKA